MRSAVETQTLTAGRRRGNRRGRRWRWPGSDRVVAVDLGTSTVCVATADRVLVDEPATTAIRADGTFLAVGGEARSLLGRNPHDVRIVSPIDQGTPTEVGDAELLLEQLLERGGLGNRRAVQTAIVAVPASAEGLARRSLVQCVQRVLPRARVVPIETPMAAAIGAGIPVHQPAGTMVVDVGAAITEAAVISHGTMISTRTAFVGGDAAARAITAHLRDERDLDVGPRTAERVVRFSSRGRRGVTVARGTHTETGLPRAVPVTSDISREVLRPVVEAIADVAKNALDSAPPALAADVMHNEIVMTGGAAHLDGLVDAVSLATGIQVRVHDVPGRAVIDGARMCLEVPGLGDSRYR